jgi:hypothetical protein
LKKSALYGKNSSNSKNHQIESDSREIFRAKSPAKEAQSAHKLHPTKTQEIVLKTPPRKSQQRDPKITTKKDGKSNTQP